MIDQAPEDFEVSTFQSDLELTLGLTHHQYRMLLSADQNGVLHGHESEVADIEFLISEGLMQWRSRRAVLADLTPKMAALLQERERRHVAQQQLSQKLERKEGVMISPVSEAQVAFKLGKQDLLRLANGMGWSVSIEKDDTTAPTAYQRGLYWLRAQRTSGGPKLDLRFDRMGEAKVALALFIVLRFIEAESKEEELVQTPAPKPAPIKKLPKPVREEGMKKTFRMQLETAKETKGCHRYRLADGDGGVETLYLRKSEVSGKAPEQILITITGV